MSRRRGRRLPTRYEDLTEEEVTQARAAVHRGERSRGQSYADEEPKSWLGRRARSLKEKLKPKDATKPDKEPGRLQKAKAWVDREVVGGLQEARDELGLDEAMAARASGKVRKIKGVARRIQATARKRTAHMGQGGMPSFMQAMSSPAPQTERISARSVARPGGPHFMGAVLHGSAPAPRQRREAPHGIGIRNPATAMGWGSPTSPARAPRKTPRKKPQGMTPGAVTIIIGGRAPGKRRKNTRRESRPVGLRW